MYAGYICDQWLMDKMSSQEKGVIFKADGFEILSYWGTVVQQTTGIINNNIRKTKLIVYLSERGTLHIDK